MATDLNSVHLQKADESVIVISDSESELEPQCETSKTNAKVDEKSLFQEFFNCCHALLSKIRGEAQVYKIEKHLRKVYEAARPDYVASEEFANSLKQHITELTKPDFKSKLVFIHISDAVVLLKNAAKKCKETITAGDENSVDKQDKAGKLVIKEERSALRDDDDDAPSVSKTCVQEKEMPCGSNDAPVLDGKSTTNDPMKHKIRRLEKLMGRLDREICRYSEKELSLEDMAREDSSHIIEHKLRKRFVEAWQKWCKLKGYKAKTGRATEKKIIFQGTRFPEINSKVQKLMKSNKFPDFHDVHHLIERTNRAKGLGIHKFDLHQLSKEVFEDIGEKMRMRRANDLICNFGYATLSNVPEDPANESPDLKARLEENANLGKQMMDSVFEKYTKKQNECMARGVDVDVDNTSEPEGIVESEGEWEEWNDDEDENGIGSSVEEDETDVPEEKGVTEIEEKVLEKQKHELNEDEPAPSKKRMHEESSDTQADNATKFIKVEKGPQSHQSFTNGGSSDRVEAKSVTPHSCTNLKQSHSPEHHNHDSTHSGKCDESRSVAPLTSAASRGTTASHDSQVSSDQCKGRTPAGIIIVKRVNGDSPGCSSEVSGTPSESSTATKGDPKHPHTDKIGPASAPSPRTPLSRKQTAPVRRVQTLYMGMSKSEHNTNSKSKHLGPNLANGVLENTAKSTDADGDDDVIIILD